MTEGVENLTYTEETELIESIRWELKSLSLDIKKESFKAKQELKTEIKRLWFYNWDESWELINFNIVKVWEYLKWIQDKSWTDLDVKSSEIEKWVWTIAIQIAINYINMINWDVVNNIDFIDGIRWRNTRKWVKTFQTTYKLENKDWLPWSETINKILEFLPNDQWLDIKNDSHKNTETLWDNIRLTYGGIDSKIGEPNNESIQTEPWLNFKKKLRDRNTHNWWLESIIYENSEFWNILTDIVIHQSKEIENMKSRYMNKKNVNESNIRQTEKKETINKDEEEPIQSWEDYKFENISLDSFEEFVLSDEWIDIIMDEIKSHIDTSHKNESDEYDRFYENYPFSIKNLEIRLKSAWNTKIHWEYYTKTYNSESREKMEKLSVLSNRIANYLDWIIWDNIKTGKETFNQDMVKTLEWFLSKWIYGVGLIEMFSEKDDKDLKDVFKWVLSDKIKYYENFVRNENNEFNLNTWDKQINLQLKSYLYLYWRIFYSNYFKANKNLEYYEDILPEVMKIIISNDDKSLIGKIKYINFLEIEKKLEEEKMKRDLKRRQEIAKINRERNERAQSTRRMDMLNIGEVQTKSMDPNSATWPEIAAEANLWEQLNDYNLNIQESDTSLQWKKEATFRAAWKEFIESHNDIKSLITQEQMRILFDINSNTINHSALERFIKSNPLLKDMPSDNVEKIRTKLLSFSSYFNNAEKILSENSSEMNVKVNETVKTYAIWTVIDNVRDTFDVITKWQSWDFKWFQLDKENPVKKEWNSIIISGLFNDSEVKVRYDLNSGSLFMNSFLHRLSPDKISIWTNSSIDYPIWTIKPFNDVLNDYYKLPPRSTKYNAVQNWSQFWWRLWMNHTNHSIHSHNGNEQWNALQSDDMPKSKPAQRAVISTPIPKIDRSDIDSRKSEATELLNSQINLIGEAIKTNTESQAQKNSAIIKFMKTFNVISGSWQFSSWDFNKWSNLYDLIDIVEKTGDPEKGNIQALEYFNNIFMPKIMEYSWLNWWKRNEYQDKNNKKSEKIFNYEWDNKNIQCLRDNTKDFNPNQFSWIANFESSHQLWFADLIKKNLILWNEMNRKLDIPKMEQFIKDIETVDKEIDRDADKKLEEQLANIN